MWDKLPLHRTVIAHGWTVTVNDLPQDHSGQAEWLFARWKEVDDWVDQALADQRSSAEAG